MLILTSASKASEGGHMPSVPMPSVPMPSVPMPGSPPLLYIFVSGAIRTLWCVHVYARSDVSICQINKCYGSIRTVRETTVDGCGVKNTCSVRVVITVCFAVLPTQHSITLASSKPTLECRFYYPPTDKLVVLFGGKPPCPLGFGPPGSVGDLSPQI